MENNNNEINNENNNENKKKKNNFAIYISTFVVLALMFFTLYIVYDKSDENPQNNTTKKVESTDNVDNNKEDVEKKASKITVELVGKDNEKQVFEHETDAKFLRQALEEIDGLKIEGEESATGLYVKTINGVTADYNVDKSYWAFYVNDEYCQSGVDTQKVTDGDIFKIEYTKGN